MARTRRGTARNLDTDEEVEGTEVDEEEELPPRRSRRSARGDDEEFEHGSADGRRRNRGTDRSEDDQDGRGTLSSGWGAVKSNKAASGSLPDRFKVKPGDDETLIKFLDDSPFATYLEHWIDEAPTKRKTYICHDDGCPLCDLLGDRPGARAAFNVVDFTDPENPVAKVWVASPNPLDKIQERAESKRTSPINRDGLYFAVSCARQKNGVVSYTVDPVKEEDLGDFDLDSEELDIDFSKFKHYDKSYIKLDPKKELREMAENILDNE